MANRFTPPWQEGSLSVVPRVTADSTPMQRRLFSKFRQVPSAQSILKTASGYTAVTNPAQTDIDTALAYYQGGRTYTVSDAEAAALTAAGYSVTVV